MPRRTMKRKHTDSTHTRPGAAKQRKLTDENQEKTEGQIVQHTSHRRTFLLVSDIHCRVEHIQPIKDYLKDKKIEQIDYILVSGDIANIKSGDYEKEDKIKEAHDIISKILESLAEICPKIFWIPGNHDPKTTFDNKLQLSKTSINAHQKVLDLEPGLLLAGFGGSPPAFFEKDNKMKWEGYPFTNDDELNKELQPLLKEIDTKLEKDANNQIIFMTHCGPEGSGTVYYQKKINDDAIVSGSKTLREVIRSQKMQDHVIVNVHGHTHPGHGVVQFAKVSIVNPGSLKEKRFGLITLNKNEKGKWYLESTNNVHLQ